MKNLCFHIGFHKTGSTTLQLHGFSLNNDLHLLSHSFPEFERTWHRDVVEAGDFEFNEAKVKCLIDTAIQALPGKAAYIVSDECLSGHGFTGFNARRNAERLYAVAPDAKIFIVIRSQISFMRSVYASYVFEGGAQTFPFWITDYKYPILSICDKLKYHLLINHYIELFGKERVLVLPFEMLKTDGINGLLQKLYSFMGLPASTVDLEQKGGEIRLRVALSNNTLLFFRLINGLRGGCSLNQRRILKLLNSLLLSRMPQVNIFKHLDVPKTEDIFRESNRITSKLIQIDLSQFGYPV